MAKDPVCGMKVDEKKAKFGSVKNGKKYYFCSRNCYEKFTGKSKEKPALKAKQDSKTQKCAISISGMHCASCAKNIEKRLKKEKGVINTSVSYATGRSSVEYDPEKISEQKIVGVINKMGYKGFFSAQDSGELATDPVCGMRVSKANSIKKQFDGRMHYFCSEECVRKFESPEEELKSMKKKVTIALSGVLLIALLR